MIKRLAFCPLLLLMTSAHGQADQPFARPLRLPALDLPYQIKASGFSPSLDAAQALTADFYLLGHGLIAQAFSSEETARAHPLEFWAIAAFDYLTMNLPLGTTWLHEEAHRSVLSHRGISSHNAVYNTQIGDDEVPVDRVRDSDLSRLKREHPADFVRLSMAGMEAESQFALTLEKDLFFYQALPRQQLLILLAHLGPIGYRSLCDSSAGDEATAEDRRSEGPDEMQRDFTGYDCVAFVYDLFRPDEAYENRGVHPSGVGVDRYRSRQDLKPTEKKFLTRMVQLSWLNLLDPFIFNFPGWSVGEGRLTATLRHHLAPFGHSLEQNIFFKNDSSRHLLIVRQYMNQKRSLPGVEWQCLSCLQSPLASSWDLRAALWLQPKALLYRSNGQQPGGSLAVRANFQLKEQAAIYAELQSKTRGWMADEIALEPASNLRLGVTWDLR